MDNVKAYGIAHPTPLFVIKLDIQNNQLIVGNEEDIFSNELEMINENILLPELIKNGEKVKAKIRYSAKEADATLKIEEEHKKIIFAEPQRAITPGQSVVLYKDDIIIAGGKIK